MKINNECVETKAMYGAMPKLSENWSMEIINTIKLKDVYINLKRFLLLVKQKRRWKKQKWKEKSSSVVPEQKENLWGDGNYKKYLKHISMF